MKAITIKQPWASLIVEGVKNIENRTWPTKFRGRVLVHSGATIAKNAVDVISKKDGELARKIWFDINDKKLPIGAIIGSVEIVDCVINHPSIWAEKTTQMSPSNSYNWVLANPIVFPEPIYVKGGPNFWDSPNIDGISGHIK